MQDLVLNAHLEAVCHFLEAAADDEQRQGVLSVKRRRALAKAVVGGVLMLVGAAAVIYGGLDVFGQVPLPGGRFVLMAGVVIVPLSGAALLTSIAQIGSAAESSGIDDIDRLCRTFYSVALCDRTPDLRTKQEELVAVAECFPVPVLQAYERSAAQVLRPVERAAADSAACACSRCGRRAERAVPARVSLPVKSQKEVAGLFVVCERCHGTTCYACEDGSTPEELRLICPQCGYSAGGWNGLARRWQALQDACSEDPTATYVLTSVEVGQSPRDDGRVVDLSIRLQGLGFGELQVKNAAIKAGDSWLLLTPEPLLEREVELQAVAAP